MKEPLVTFLPASADACALWRMFIPHLNIERSRYCFNPGRLPTREFAESDVVVVQRQTTQGNLAAMKAMKKLGYRVVYDLDDNLWSVPKFNPAYSIFEQMKDGFGRCAELSDIITVSTPGLATAVRTHILPKQEVVVVPNAIDYRYFGQPTVSRDDEKTLIAWSGSNTHSEDVKDVWPLVLEVLKENPHVQFELVGGDKDSALESNPQVRRRQWVPVGEFAARYATWAWDIVLAPLTDVRFNTSKSNIRLLEATAVGAAFLCSDVQPYTQFCELGGDVLKWCVCHRLEDWKEKMTALVNDVQLRQSVASRARQVAEAHYSIDRIKENWKRVFRKACGWSG